MRSREAEQVSHEVARLLMRNTEEPHLVASFLAESGRLVGGVCEGRWPAADQRRAVHTLKGSALVMGLDALGASLHNIEERMAGEETGTCSEPIAPSSADAGMPSPVPWCPCSNGMPPTNCGLSPPRWPPSSPWSRQDGLAPSCSRRCTT